MAKNTKRSIEDCIRLAAQKNGKCLSEKYINVHSQLIWECGQCGNLWKAAFNDINRGGWCPKCGRNKKTAERNRQRAKPKIVCTIEGCNEMSLCRNLCPKHYSKDMREKNKDKIRKWGYDYRETYRHWKASLKRKYGLEYEAYLNMVKIQNNTCAICKKEETVMNKRTKKPVLLSVDHNHTTGKVRGLLCRRCNQAIGLMHEDINIFESAVIYLKNCLEEEK